jgi:branched-chain amino acid transport system permease protein
MSTFLLLTVTGLGLGAMYFLIASGLSLIYGLMGVLNFAHGAFITVGSYGTWWTSVHVFDGIHSSLWRWLLSSLLGLAFGGAHIPNDRWVEIATAAVVLGLLQLFLRRTRYGLIIRAGVENRAMVQALGIDVRKAFTLVFAIGGIAAAIAGVLSGVYFNAVSPEQGTSLLIFAFIVVVIGGLGSIGGSAAAAVIVGLVQQYTNYYGSSGVGDMIVVLLLGIVLLTRPRGIAGAVVGARA